MAIASVRRMGMVVEIAALHLLWPWPFNQSQQIGRIEADLGALGERAVVVGDFNAVRWSAAARRIAEAGDLKPAGHFGPTWPADPLPRALRFLGLPIDLALMGERIELTGARTLHPVGSDHLPVLLQFSLRPGSSADGSAPATGRDAVGVSE